MTTVQCLVGSLDSTGCCILLTDSSVNLDPKKYIWMQPLAMSTTSWDSQGVHPEIIIPDSNQGDEEFSQAIGHMLNPLRTSVAQSTRAT